MVMEQNGASAVSREETKVDEGKLQSTHKRAGCTESARFIMFHMCAVMVEEGGGAHAGGTHPTGLESIHCSPSSVEPGPETGWCVDNTAQMLWSDVCLSLEKVFFKK